jgi:hypothetical protein
MALIGMADAMLTDLESVESAEQLDQKLQGLFGPLLGGLLGPGADVEFDSGADDPAATEG